MQDVKLKGKDFKDIFSPEERKKMCAKQKINYSNRVMLIIQRQKSSPSDY